MGYSVAAPMRNMGPENPKNNGQYETFTHICGTIRNTISYREFPMGQELDSIDRALLRSLQQDATRSVAALAETHHLSKSACWRRVQRLEEAGVITATVAQVDPQAVGLALTVFIRVRTREHTEHWSRQFRDNVEAIDGVMEVYRMGGDIDYLIKAVVEDMPAYDRLYQKLIKVDLFDVTASFVMEEIKKSHALPL